MIKDKAPSTPASTGPKSEDLLARRQRVVPRGLGVVTHVTSVSARGAIVTDADGRELIDFAGGIGVVNAGHCPEPVVEAIVRQARAFIHTSFTVMTYEPYVALCEKLTQILPHGDHTKAMLVSTGAEAVENAIKIARQATRRPAVLCFTDAFHGRTMMAMTLTSKVGYKTGCGPFAPEVYRLRYPNYYRYHGSLDTDAFVAGELNRLRDSAHHTVDPRRLAAIIIEPVLGEGGFYPAPESYLRGLREYCDEHGIVLIFDEVQSGFARTGRWASWQHYDITPDLCTYAKSMGSGMPIAAVVGKADVMDAALPGTIGGTYIGNPVSCAAALATIDYMEQIDLHTRARQVGNIIRGRFEKMKQRFGAIGDVHGLGAMMAIEFVKDGDPRRPDSDLGHRIVDNCARQGLILIPAGTFKNIIRVLCPLVIEDDQLTRGLDILESELEKATQG